MPDHITVTEASRRFSDLINRVFYRHESTVLLKGGKPVAQIIPVKSRAKTGRELAALWAVGERADAAFGTEIESARASIGIPRDPWA